jgi:hypothetical protein
MVLTANMVTKLTIKIFLRNTSRQDRREWGGREDLSNPVVAKDFPELLNVTVIQRIYLKDGKAGHVVLSVMTLSCHTIR